MTSFYNNQLINLLQELPKLPIVIFPSSNNIISLDFSKLNKIDNYDKANQLFLYVISTNSLLDLQFTTRFMIKLYEVEFYLVSSILSTKTERNLNETASLIMRLYAGAFLTDFTHYNSNIFNIYGPCILLPCKILDKLNAKKKNLSKID